MVRSALEEVVVKTAVEAHDADMTGPLEKKIDTLDDKASEAV